MTASFWGPTTPSIPSISVFKGLTLNPINSRVKHSSIFLLWGSAEKIKHSRTSKSQQGAVAAWGILSEVAAIQWRHKGKKRYREFRWRLQEITSSSLRFLSACFFSCPEVLSGMVSRQASPGVGGLPLLSEEGHGLVRGAEPLARHFLMQRHPLRRRETKIIIMDVQSEDLCLWP